MPRIEQQSPARRPRDNPSANGPAGKPSILDEAVDIAEVENVWIKLLLYGQNGVGKTTLACQFPKPLLLLALEPTLTGGAISVRRVPGVKYLRLTATAKARQLADELKAANPFKTIVLDSATSYQDIVLKELLDLEMPYEQLNWGLVGEDQYRQRSEKTREALRPFLDLPCHTVVVAKERDHNANKGDRKPKIMNERAIRSGQLVLSESLQIAPFLAADLGGATVGWLHDACDYIGRLSIEKERKEVEQTRTVAGKVSKQKEVVETGRLVQRLQTVFHPSAAARFRSEVPGSVPDYVEAALGPNGPQEMYAAVMRVITGEKTK